MAAATLTPAALAHALGDAKKTPTGFRCRCPGHDDHHGNLDIRAGNKQPIILTCRVCGNSPEAQARIIAELKARGLWDEVAAARAARTAPEPQRKLLRTLRYEIRDLAGRHVATHIRKEFDDKSKDMPWEPAGVKPAELPLFQIEKTTDSSDGETVVLGEGEKAAAVLWERRVLAVGTVTGADKAGQKVHCDESLKPLVRLDVVLWPDNDSPGVRHMRAHADALVRLGCKSVRWLDWKEAPPKGDAADFGGTDEELLALIDAAQPYTEKPVEQPDNDDFCVRADTVETKPVDWIIPLHLARGKMHEWNGNPKEGKTTVLLDFLARISSGRSFPDGAITPECVMFLSGEDSKEDTLAPRLIEAGADMKKVFLLNSSFPSEDEDGVPDGQGLTPVSFPEHIEKIEHYIITKGVAVFVIDPVAAFLSGSVQSHNDASARKALCELSAMAERTDCAIVLVRHLNKMSSEDKALYRGGGSIAFSAAARIGFTVGPDPTEQGVQDSDPQRRYVMACHANNLGPKAPSRAFRKEVAPRTITEDDPYGVVHIEWLAGTVAVTADDLVRPQHKQRNAEALAEAVDFLRDELRERDRPVTDVEAKARALRISETTLKRARKKLGVRSRPKGFAGGRVLYLPVTDEPEHED